MDLKTNFLTENFFNKYLRNLSFSIILLIYIVNKKDFYNYYCTTFSGFNRSFFINWGIGHLANTLQGDSKSKIRYS